MSTREYNAFSEHGLPALASGNKPTRTAHLVFSHLCWRYDTREGKKRAYPGMDELLRVTGAGSRTTIQDALKELLNAGLIERVTRGRGGRRAEYVPSYAVRLLANCPLCKSETHSMARAKSKATGTPEVVSGTPEVVSGTPEVVTGGTTLVTGALVAINTEHTNIDTSKYVNSKTIKDNVSISEQLPKSAPRRINVERWQVVTNEVPKDVLRNITPSSYSENLLDQAINNGHTLSHLRWHFGRMKWGSSYDNGGLFISELRKLAGVPTPPKDGSPAWCGREGCDPLTRTWVEPSSRSDGTPTHNCPQCHPLEVRTTTTSAGSPELRNFLDENLKDFGKLD